MFTLTRVSADRTITHEFPTKRAASIHASYGIYDNGHGSKAEAQRFAAALGKLPLGTGAVFGPYEFTITKATA